MVKIYACNKATKSSIIEIAKDNTKVKLLPIQLWNTNIKPIRLINTMCPAIMFAYKRIIRAKGLMITPNNSIGANIIFMGTGTPGIQNICFQ